MRSDPKLRRLYRRFNHIYFNDELPDDVPVIWMPCGPNAGLTIAGEYEGKPVIQIQIDTSLPALPRYTKLVLLHEMIHVKLRQNRCKEHGRKFDEERQRLLSYKAVRDLV